jgi:hypothetical protein
MEILFTMDEFEKANSNQKLPLKCEWCRKTFYIEKRFLKQNLTSKENKRRKSSRFCSSQCAHASLNKTIENDCDHCGKKIFRQPSQKRKSKSGKIFCSQSCAATYNNTHKTTGIRRSKLEKWLEEQLHFLYPTLECKYNCKDDVNSELDIYIPSLNLAFELNGIFHYEPIYGEDKLVSIKNNDNRKFQACLENKIELVIIDSSGLKYFKPSNAQKYLDIISNIINNKITLCA